MRALAALGCLLLLAGPTEGAALLGQSPEDPEGAVLPARLAVATAAQVVASAIAEAQRDGTPDEAQAQVEGLRAMARAMAREPMPESASFRGLAQASVAYVAEVADALGGLPGEIAAVERVRANCDAWFHNASIVERFGWAQWARPALLSLRGRVDLLDALAERPPAHVDPGPLRAAAAQLRDEMRPRNEEACLPPALPPPDPPAPDFLVLILSPTSAYPTSAVTAVIVSSRPGAALLESDLVRAEVPVNPSGTLRFTVPVDAAIGPHVLTARLGAAQANATLQVVRAPSRLLLDAPASVLVGREARVLVRLVTPLPGLAGEAPVTVDGNRTGEVRLADGQGAFPFTGDAPGALRLRFRYPGTAQVEPAEAEAVVQVVDPAVAAAALPPPPAPVVPLVPLGSPARGAPLALLALAGLVAAAGVAWALRRRRRTQGLAGAIPSAPAGAVPPPALPEGVVGIMVAIVHALRARGLAQPSDTVREVAARVPHAEVRALVRPFERTRYGALPDEAAPSLLARAVQRVRTWLGGMA